MDIEKYLNKLPVNELYKDLFKPGMQKAGTALETVIDGANLILLPLKLLNAKSKVYFERNLEIYSEKLNVENDLTLTQVPQYVGLPIIDKLTYLDQNELAEAFINLLTKASYEETLKLVHPAFISILNNLSADEAKILYTFKNTDKIPFIDLYIRRYIETFEKPDENGAKTKEGLKKLIDYTFQEKQDTFLKYAWNLTGIQNEVELLFPENIDIYLENLELNGLIQFERELHSKSLLEKYQQLLEHDHFETYEKLKKVIEENTSDFKLEINIRKGYIEFTELGKAFLEACIKELK
ncbi:DUF4393 domain-containing protein [Flavobacterium amnicola]|uniref:DUF4393 domain-containing protein n=1 Tax=Flavobacterium amnicola TaxID=2506422 RepID=A0A4Q1K024_9FLAO|nr:DUF4393 domain-containing protein [Flavobacterium amnicola]RXR15970.1 DUF4393 domain-containing protein [Flavobacterium amnicola]